MAEKRQVILVPYGDDLTPDGRKYWENFICRVQQALANDRLDCVVLIAAPPPPQEPR